MNYSDIRITLKAKVLNLNEHHFSLLEIESKTNINSDQLYRIFRENKVEYWNAHNHNKLRNRDHEVDYIRKQRRKKEVEQRTREKKYPFKYNTCKEIVDRLCILLIKLTLKKNPEDKIVDSGSDKLILKEMKRLDKKYDKLHCKEDKTKLTWKKYINEEED